MILVALDYEAGASGIPHVCRDDPKLMGAFRKFSGVFPTYVGMIPRHSGFYIDIVSQT